MQEQKDELCETLSHCIEGSVSAVDNVRKSLMEFVEKNNKNHPTHGSTANQRATSSAAMEMVLAAYYRGLIDQVCMMELCREWIF